MKLPKTLIASMLLASVVGNAQAVKNPPKAAKPVKTTTKTPKKDTSKLEVKTRPQTNTAVPKRSHFVCEACGMG